MSAAHLRLMALLCGAAALVAAAPAAAHHGWSSFDTRHAYYASGSVTQVRWGNPHSEVRLRIDKTALPADWAARKLPPGANETDGPLTLRSARPYSGEQPELHLVLAGPEWIKRWGLERPLRVGERLEVVGYLAATDRDALRPVMFWLDNDQGVWQQLTASPAVRMRRPAGEHGARPSALRLRAASMNLSPWLASLFGWLEGTAAGEAVRITPYLYPMLESLHIIGIALLFGSIVPLDLRLLGVGRGVLPVTTVARHLLPLSFLGFALAAATGSALFTASAMAVGASPAAPWKLALSSLQA